MRAKELSIDTPYSQAYATYRALMDARKGSGETFTVDDLAMALLVGNTLTTTYFLASVDTGQIKIGKTINLRDRLTTLQGSSPVPLTLAYYFEFDDGLESRIHGYLSDYRGHGEWFDATPEVVDFIRNLKNNGAEWLVKELGEGCRNWAFSQPVEPSLKYLAFSSFFKLKKEDKVLLDL